MNTLTGAPGPTSSDPGPSRRSARPDSRRARLSGVLSVLALLACALSPLVAAPASAAVLVSNINQLQSRSNDQISKWALAQGFTTGSNSLGYTLDSVAVGLQATAALTANERSLVKAQLWSSDSGSPDDKIADLTVPSSIPVGTNIITFAAPSGTSLEAGTEYHFVIFTTGTSLTKARVQKDSVDSEDGGGAAGWSIANGQKWFRNNGAAPTASTTWSSEGNSLRIRVSGSVNSLPGRPTGLGAHGAFETMLLTWTAPTGTVTGYDVHLTRSTTVDDDAEAGTNRVSEWVDAGHTGTAATMKIVGLPATAEFRYRVRAVNGFGDGDWTFVRGRAARIGEPADLDVTPGDAKLDLAWTAPSGTTLTGYDVHYTSAPDTGQNAVDDEDEAGSNTDASAGWVAVSRTEADPPAASQSITGLTNGTEYRVRVRGKNVAGEGNWAHETGTPAVPSLARPGNLAAQPLVNSVVLNWTAPSGTVTGYDVHYTVSSTVEEDAEAGTDALTGWVDLEHTGTTATMTVSPLSVREYRFRVRAVNANGDGAWAFVRGTPTAPPVTSTGLVSNFGETVATSDARLGTDRTVAQAFRTGSATRGYNLASVEVRLQGNVGPNARNSMQAQVWLDSGSGTPSEVTHELTVPAHPINAGTVSFTAPSGAILQPDTTYWVVIWANPINNGLKTTASDSQAGAAGWSIDNAFRYTGNPPSGSSTWNTPTGGRSVLLTVKGRSRSAPDAPTFSPADGATVADPGTDITLTFAEAIRADASDTAFTNATIDAILTLKKGGSTGDDIGFDATIDSAGTTVTIDPDADLEDGAVYVAVSDSWYEAGGVQGAAAEATFTVDSMAPAGTVWSATLTVQNLSTRGLGCDDSFALNLFKCSTETVLTNSTIGDSSVTSFRLLSSGALAVTVNQALDADLRALNLCVGPTAFALTAATASTITWNSSGLSWSTGDTVSLSIGSACRAAAAVPGAPTNLAATPGDARLDLTWTAPSGTVTGYDVHYTSSATVDENARGGVSAPAVGWVDANHTGTTASLALTGLTNGTAYRVRVRAANAVGDGEWARVTATPTAPTLGWSATLTPQNLGSGFRGCDDTLAGVGTIYICEPSGALTDDDFTVGGTSYQVEAVDLNSAGTAVRVKFDTAPDTALKALNFCVGSRAFAFSSAAFTSGGTVAKWSGISPALSWTAGTGVPLSIEESCTTGGPGVPTGLSAAGSDFQLDLTWTAPSGTVTGYDVHYTSSASAGNDDAASGDDPSAGWVDGGHVGTVASFTISGLAKGTQYRVRVRGVNANGAGAWVRATQTVPNTAPGAPTHFNVVPEYQKLDLSWIAPADTGGKILFYYVVHYTSSETVGNDAPVSGTNPASGWAPAPGDGPGSALSYAVTGLTDGTAYRVRVRTSNGIGSSAWAHGGGTPNPGHQLASRLTGLSLSAGGNAVTLAPAFSGARLTGYRATVPAGTASVSVTPAWTAASTTIRVGSTSLDGTQITPESTINSLGDSKTVNLASTGDTLVYVTTTRAQGVNRYVIAVSKPAPPSVPRNVHVTPGDAKLTLTWQAPASWGTWGPGTYHIEWKTSTATYWNFAVLHGQTIGSDSTRLVFSGQQEDPVLGTQPVATNGIAYDLQIRAVNIRPGTDGSNTADRLSSNWVTVSGTPAAVLPGAPTDLSVAGTGVDGWLNVTWTAPSGPVTGYDVHYTSASEDDVGNDDAASGSDPAAAWVDAEHDGTSVSMVLTGLTVGTAYRVRVRGVNEGGDGGWARGTGTPTGASPPAVPQSLTVTAGDGQLDLSWGTPFGATGYDVHYTSAPATGSGAVGNDDAASGSDPSAAWVDAGHTGGTASQALTGLDNGTAYRVRVRGLNAAGNGGWARGTGTPMSAAMRPAPRSLPTGGAQLWSATLNVQDVTVANGVVYKRGCSNSVGEKLCTMHLTDDSLQLDGAEYEVAEVGLIGGALRFRLNKTLVGAKRRLVLVVDGTRFAGRDATFTAPSGGTPANAELQWSNAGLAWSAGDRVMLSLVEIPTVHLAVKPNPVPEGTHVAIEASLWRGSDAGAGTVSHIPQGSVTIEVILTPGTADARWDYGEGSPRGDGTRRCFIGIHRAHQLSYGVCNIPTHRDRDADDETFTVALATNSLPSSLVAGDTVSVEVTIEDLDEPADPRPAARLAGPAEPVPEGAPAGVSLMLSSVLGSTVTIPLTVTPGSAEAGDHATSASVTIPAGRCCNTVLIETVADADGDDETFTVALDADSLPPEVRLGDPASVAVTIADDGVVPGAETPTVTIAAGGPVTEGAPAGFTLNAAPAPAADLAVAVTIAQRGDFAEAAALGARTVTIPAGAASAAFTVATVDDAVDEPDGFVAATLGAGDGYELGGAKRARVAVADDDEGLPRIVAKKRTAREGSDDVVRFAVHLDRAAPDVVTVDYATADGAGPLKVLHNGIMVASGTRPATAGADYTAVSGTLTYAPGQRLKFVEVPLLDDAVDEGTEYFLLRFSNPVGAELATGETQGLISNDDHLQSTWLSRLGRTVGGQVADAVSERLRDGLSPGAHATLAGRPLDLAGAEDGTVLTDAMTAVALALGAREEPAAGDGPLAGRDAEVPSLRTVPAATIAARSATGREILLGSAFHVAPSRGPGLAAWGRVAHGSFGGVHADGTGRTRVDGEVTTGILGVDAEWRRLLAGVAVSLSEGEGRFDNADADVGGKGGIESTMTTVSPYARLRLTGRVTAWGLAGRGTGEMTLRFDDGGMAPVRTGLSMRLGALGARGDLLRQDGAGGMDLALRADALFVTTESEAAANSAATASDASRVRLVLEGGRAFGLDGGATLRPRLELGLRHDGGDAETGLGLDVGGGIAYADEARGLSLSLDARTLATHEDGAFRDWGLGLGLAWDPRPETKRGWSLSARQSLGGASSGGVDALLGPEAFPGLSGTDGAGSWSLEAAHGTGRGNGMVGSAYGRAEGAGDGGGMRLGYRIEPDADHAADASVDLWARPGTDGHEAGAGLEWRW